MTDAKKFESWLNGAISGCTIPAHNQVVNHSVVMGNGTQGFVVTHIPKSNNAPHQVVGKSQYYIRAGSDFVPAPHAVLAGMFGRRPQPSMKMDLLFSPLQIYDGVVTIDFGFIVHNGGPGIAEDIFFDLMMISQPGSNCQMSFGNPNTSQWQANFVFERQMWLISAPDIRMPPGARLMPITMKIILKGPFAEALELEGRFGCRNWPSTKFRIVCSKDEVNSLFDQILKANVSGELTEKFETNWVSRLLKYE